jgi:hypothetical protein
MLDGHATGFDKEARHITLQHRVVLAEASAHFPQYSLNKLLLGGEALTQISCQLSSIAQRREDVWYGTEGQG